MPRKKRPPEAPAPQPDPILPSVNPAVEDRAGTTETLPFPIVAIGASAGGLDAFTRLLKSLPPDTGMAFVVIQHLPSTHESLLSDILARATRMPVAQVQGRVAVEPNHVYVIPPGKHLVFADRELRLEPLAVRGGQARPVDHFMRSLAQAHGHKAIGVVLSGMGNDGTLGMEEIQAAGGITFAQDASAEQGAMPGSVVAAGAVDFVLPPEEIARELSRIAAHPYVAPGPEEGPLRLGDQDIARVLQLVRERSGVDFSHYKRNTLYRRIGRRMLLHKMDSVAEYLARLQGDPGEVESLYQDILINVTSFFRNPEAYEALKASVFPRLAEGRGRLEQIRVWVLGCSTGEEAYSIAMAFTEYAEAAGERAGMQIFATDLNGSGVEKARNAVYAKGIVQDVSPDRLRRFFNEVDGGYRICKPIRDMCVFARHNALADPPFSRTDLVACRNMLIYLDPVLQQKLIPLLHYALRGAGFLWLGNSETIGSYRNLFELFDAKNKIYARRPVGTAGVTLPAASRRDEPRPVERRLPAAPPALPSDAQHEADRVLLSRYAPPSVVVDGDLDILQFRGDTSPYLSPAPGKASLNLPKMLREGLAGAVRGAINRARRDAMAVREEGLRVRSNGGWRRVDVVAIPLKASSTEAGSLLVLFEEPASKVEARARQLEAQAREQVAKGTQGEGDVHNEAARLRQELAATRDYLQSVIEQQEAANEELQAANEEVQSANEELQSINEELETSKEEIQSSNEELATVNDQLQTRNLELSQSNNDLTNLIAGMQVAIVMLGRDLRIRRFTPAAEKLLNLTAHDLGRPVGELRLNVAVEDLEAMVREVVDTMSVRSREAQDRDGRWYSLCVRPYRTLENAIEGAVVMLVDVDSLRKAEQAFRESEARFELLANSAPVLVWMNDTDGLRFVNRAFEDFVGAQESEIRQADLARFVHPDDRAGFVQAYEEAMRAKKTFEARLRFRRADGEYRWMKSVGLPRFVADGELLGYVGCTFDITDMKEAEQALLELDRGKNEFLAMLAHELRNPLAGVRNASRLLTDTRDGAVIARAREIIDRQTAHMVRMVDDLLDVSRITHGKIQIRSEPLDVVTVLRRALDATAQERKLADQDLALSVPESPVWVRGDPMRLDQVFCNLLNNASKFTPHGGKIWVSAAREPAGSRSAREPVVAIHFRDNGAGIDPALLPRVFDLFVQADRAGLTRTGIGLGLTLARRLVDLHGGTIEALSGGKAMGAEFVVRIPLLPEAEIPKSGARADGSLRQPVSPRRILIVDDNRDSAESLRLMFDLAGHDVRAVHDGASTLPEAAAFQPHAVLLDIGLPDMDGYEVARRLRADPSTRDVLIVAISGYGRDEDVRRSREAGIDDHLTKPIDPDALLQRIARGRAVASAS